MKWTLDQIAQWTNGQILSRHQEKFEQVGTDTRVDLSGHIFIALAGDQFDAHQFLDKAVQKGAALLIVHTDNDLVKELSKSVSVILVQDTLKALQNFSHGYRKTLKAKVVGITGSNGKTSTKEYLAALISPVKNTHFNQGSFNNHWGVPLTLLGASAENEVIICEMGMNHAGELTALVHIAEPDVVVCTMVGTAHIEHFGSQKKIAEAKSEIYMETSEETIRIFNQDLDLTFDMMYPVAKKFPASRMLSFSEKNKEADVYFKLEAFDQKGLTISGSIAAVPGKVTVTVFGKHNITNLMAAANCAYVLDVKPEVIWKNLSLCGSAWGRNQFIQSSKDINILFDGYNANPESMMALIDNVKSLELDTRLIFALGQMKELGAAAAEAHQLLAQAVASLKPHFIFFEGENHTDFENGLKTMGYVDYHCAADLDESMKQHFVESLRPDDFVVIKGSRGARTERFVELCAPVGWEKSN